ncbi:MAG: penicillin-binding protein 2 [Legionellaceae bacterium]|nr:penicillin-binding protein 2 [Legionellaceae bacterium]
MVWLTVFQREFLSTQGQARSVRILDVPAYRGMITDRQGQPLAVSTPVQSLWVNPAHFNAEPAELAALAKLLNMTPDALQQRIISAKNRGFLYLQRHLSPSFVDKIKALPITGLNFQQEFKRYYPEGRSAAQLLGFTNIDDQGQEGIELQYQEWLRGENGKKKVLKDRKGHIVDETERIKEPRPGHNLTLSIDRRIQYIAYHELSKTLQESSAKSGTVVVIDSQTGEVLAVANAPSFNPNRRNRYDPDSYRNRAFTDSFEPGSVIKPFSLASALESGQFRPDSIIDTRPSWMMVHGHAIRDGRNYGVLDVGGVLSHSSNVGVTKMVLASPAEQLISLLQRSGFGERTESGYPGEIEGILPRATQVDPFMQATLGFGYGLSVSAIQLAKAFSVIANEGKLLPLSLLYQNTAPQGRQVLSSETAKQILLMMEKVVGKEGTGKKAQIAGYRVAGKTGTSRIADDKGYDADRHIASFVGIAPVSQPRLIVVAVIYEPGKGSYYGGAVAAPLFARVMRGALRILDIPPDQSTVSAS